MSGFQNVSAARHNLDKILVYMSSANFSSTISHLLACEISVVRNPKTFHLSDNLDKSHVYLSTANVQQFCTSWHVKDLIFGIPKVISYQTTLTKRSTCPQLIKSLMSGIPKLFSFQADLVKIMFTCPQLIISKM